VGSAGSAAASVPPSPVAAAPAAGTAAARLVPRLADFHRFGGGLATLFAERHARVAALKVEGPSMLRSGNFRRAAELCSAWADLELANAEAWRCLGEAQEALGNHQDALNAFRKAKQHDPNDRSVDAAIERSQKGIVGDFRNRYRK